MKSNAEKIVSTLRHIISAFLGRIQYSTDGNRIINRGKIHHPAFGRVCGTTFPDVFDFREWEIRIRLLIIFLMLICSKTIKANNIQVSNVSLTGQNTTSGFTLVQFDLTWENSWRVAAGPSNWDAAWVFVKYRVNNGDWLHAFLNDAGHSTGTGTPATITPGLLNTGNAFNATSNPAMGVFIYRGENGVGKFSQTGIKLRWNYGINTLPDLSLVDLKVFAVEMVYVPQAAFRVGDGTTTNIQGQFRNGSANSPLTIVSENALTLGGTSNGNLANNNATGMIDPDDFNDFTTRTLPAAFPKGFNAFYCMKYETSQQQWIDFFNTLSSTQKPARDITGGTYNTTGKASDALVNRNNISWTSGDAILNGGTHDNVACNFLSWMDGAAFADWASLRPMTELEFEKACRGTSAALANEYAWGTTNITGATGISNGGAFDETASNATSNISYNNNASVQGPLRVGSFASAGDNREQAGASFYGILDLSGNVLERTVMVGHSVGRGFTRVLHGNGILTSDGFCDISTWPGFSGGKITTTTGAGFRGGSWDHNITEVRLSDRTHASRIPNSTQRYFTRGFRGVRSAP